MAYMVQALNPSWNTSQKCPIYKTLSVSLAPWILCCDFEVFEIICWSHKMIPSCITWWLSCQELPVFHNLDLCFYFLSVVCTYWSYCVFSKSKVTAVTLITERSFCFWLSSSELFRKKHFENTFHKVKLMLSFPSKLITFVLYKAWMGYTFSSWQPVFLSSDLFYKCSFFC